MARRKNKLHYHCYKITNLINGKCYIGKTRIENSLKTFCQNNDYYYESVSMISRGLRKSHKDIISVKKLTERRTIIKNKRYKKNQILSKKYLGLFTDGTSEIIHGLYQWCKENKYSPSCIFRLMNGEISHHKDITSIKKL